MTIIARDEEDRLPDALASVSFADEVVVVVDAASTDRTEEIARASGARVLVRAFDGFGAQKNAAAAEASSSWILSLDADEIASPELAVELRGRLFELAARRKRVGEAPPAFRIPIRLEFLGRPLRFGRDTVVRPVRLYDRRYARFTEDPVHERVVSTGPIDALDESILHRSYRDLSHYLQKLDLYTTLAARAKQSQGKGAPRFLSLRVAWEFFDRAFLRLGLLDGTAGLTFALLSAGNTLLKYQKLTELRTLPERAVPPAAEGSRPAEVPVPAARTPLETS
ncbi:MAG: glycosyltransferase family 2 protein [Thermoanaerobaculia bacterium]